MRAAAWLAAALCGCSTTAGSVVTDVKQGADGRVWVRKCTLRGTYDGTNLTKLSTTDCRERALPTPAQCAEDSSKRGCHEDGDE